MDNLERGKGPTVTTKTRVILLYWPSLGLPAIMVAEEGVNHFAFREYHMMPL